MLNGDEERITRSGCRIGKLAARLPRNSMLATHNSRYTCAMKQRLFASALIWLTCAASAYAAPPIELELATERGVQITAPHEWLQLLAGIGIEHVQIRGIRAGDEPKVENRGAKQQPNYH